MIPPEYAWHGSVAASIMALAAACGGESPAPAAGASGVVTEIRGDTTIVRTLSGSEWGGDAVLVPELVIGEVDGSPEYLFAFVSSLDVDDEGRIYVFEAQAREVRVFDANGAYLRTLGGPGEGPGEISSVGSLALMSDGRLAVHDPYARKVELFGPGERERSSWRYAVLRSLDIGWTPIHAGRSGRLFVPTFETARDGFRFPRLLAFEAGRSAPDTLFPPGGDYRPPSHTWYPDPEVRAAAGFVGTSQPVLVPLTARYHWALDPDGRFVSALSTDYRIDVQREDGVLRIEKDWEPVPVSGAERDHLLERAVGGLDASGFRWSRDGPPVPAVKPPFRGIHAGRDGRIWVDVWTKTVAEGGADLVRAAPLRYDVFELDGTYLGAVVPPENFALSSRPVFDGDRVWGVTHDELGIERVVRYRIQPPGFR